MSDVDGLLHRGFSAKADCAANSTDHLILVQLGTQTANPGKTPEESERFNTGLRNLIQRLKAQNISDIERIAEHIVRYRREFIGDNSALVGID